MHCSQSEVLRARGTLDNNLDCQRASETALPSAALNTPEPHRSVLVLEMEAAGSEGEATSLTEGCLRGVGSNLLELTGPSFLDGSVHG